MDTLISRTLVRVVVVYVTAATATYAFMRWYRPSLDGTDAAQAAALVAVPLAAALGYFLGVRGCREEERLILRSMERPNLEDGQRIAAIGPVVALGPLLTSPFTRASCVAYQYDIDHKSPYRSRSRQYTRVRDYWGMAVTPFQIRTPAGPVRVLGYARLETFPSELPDGDDAYRAAEAYVQSTRYRHPTSAGERFGSLAEPIETESDTFRDDICANASHVSPAELRKLRLTERRLDAGQAVCAVGFYSAAKKALVPTRRGVKQLRIGTYSPELWASESRDSARSMVRWGSGFAILGVGCALATRWC